MSDFVSQLANEIEAELRAAFLDAIEDMHVHVDVPSLIAAADRGDDDAVLGYVGDRLRRLADILVTSFRRAGTTAAERLGLRFDPSEPSADAARASAVASIMKSLAADTASAMMQAAFRSTLDTAPHLVRDAIGLSPAQGASLAVFRRALEQELARQQPAPARTIGFTRERAGIPDLPAEALRHLSAPQRSVIEKAARLTLDKAKVDALVAQQRRALLDIRAAAIGTSGALTITNAGEHAAWAQAVNQRDLGPNWRRFWIDRADERVRHAHREVKALNPEGVAIGEPFDTALGPCLHPPLERGCRCRVELREMPA